jgi:hypothetical protein
MLAFVAGLGSSPSRAQEHSAGYDWEKWREFWAFKPVVKREVPKTSDPSWVRTPVDAFVLARLEKEGLKPAPEADKDTLIRRLTFDLTGLPPTPEEIRAFRADKSPHAYEKLVERLLASPHYGERWGRHWLDVARYAPGRINFPGVKNTRGDQAYRDYVVRAFNTDKPYDRFVTEQLAGDLLPPTADKQQYFDQITAPAFLSIGAWFDMETDPNRLRLEMVDEQVNTVSKALLGLTVACARCHDHKTDPIPTEDYYALGGIFRSTRLVGDLSEFWRDGRVRQLRPLAMPEQVAANDAIRRQIDAKKDERWQFLTDQHAKLISAWRADEAKYRAVAAQLPRPTLLKTIEAENFDGQDNLRITQLMRNGRSVEVLETQTPGVQWVKYKVEVPETGLYRMDVLYSTAVGDPVYLQANGTTVADNALDEPTGGWDLQYQRWDTLATFEMRKGLNFLRLNLKAGDFPRLDKIRFISQNKATEEQIVEAASANGLDPRLLVNFVYDADKPWPTVAGIVDYLDDAAKQTLVNLQNKATALAGQITNYEQVIAVTDLAEPADLPVHIRGETYSTSKHTVPRGTLRLFDALLPRPSISPGSSGRLELARWLTDPRNPLPARVMANRVWHWHFGRGIVATTSDFGSTGEAPTHPELLDWLAATFVENGWSVKHLHRLIVTSSTYRQSSLPAAQHGATRTNTAQHVVRAGAERTQFETDPENRLLARFPRRRLEAEAIYDAMRSTTNMIPRQEPGAPLDLEKSAQRAMYVLSNGRAPISGNEVRKFFTLYDYDSLAAVHVPSRQTSQTPAQSLFWMNGPLVKFMADRFADRLLKMDKLDDAKRVEMAYLLALGREPGKDMKAQALAYLEQVQSEDGLSPKEAWSKLCQALYGTAEFRYVE